MPCWTGGDVSRHGRADWYLKVFLAASSAPALGQAAAGSCSSTAAFCDFIEGDVSAGIRAYKHYVQEALQHICAERAQRRMAASSQAVVLANAFPVRGPRQVPKQILRFLMDWDHEIHLQTALEPVGVRRKVWQTLARQNCDLCCMWPSDDCSAARDGTNTDSPWKSGRDHQCETSCARSPVLWGSHSLLLWQQP